MSRHPSSLPGFRNSHGPVGTRHQLEMALYAWSFPSATGSLHLGLVPCSSSFDDSLVLGVCRTSSLLCLFFFTRQICEGQPRSLTDRLPTALLSNALSVPRPPASTEIIDLASQQTRLFLYALRFSVGSHLQPAAWSTTNGRHHWYVSQPSRTACAPAEPKLETPAQEPGKQAYSDQRKCPWQLRCDLVTPSPPLTRHLNSQQEGMGISRVLSLPASGVVWCTPRKAVSSIFERRSQRQRVYWLFPVLIADGTYESQAGYES